MPGGRSRREFLASANAAAFTCAAVTFTEHRDTGSPVGMGLMLYNPLGVSANLGVGIGLLIISIQAAKCE